MSTSTSFGINALFRPVALLFVLLMLTNGTSPVEGKAFLGLTDPERHSAKILKYLELRRIALPDENTKAHILELADSIRSYSGFDNIDDAIEEWFTDNPGAAATEAAEVANAKAISDAINKYQQAANKDHPKTAGIDLNQSYEGLKDEEHFNTITGQEPADKTASEQPEKDDSDIKLFVVVVILFLLAIIAIAFLKLCMSIPEFITNVLSGIGK